MNYPLISEYIDSIMCAEDNFATLTNLRPVLGNEGKPIMSSGNFAVVFKMQDTTAKKKYAVKCFIKEQPGRNLAYKAICEGLNKEKSKHIVSFQYYESELFVALSGGDEIEVPVLKMDWIEGLPLDKYIEENIKDKFRLIYLAYQFIHFTDWLLSRDFAHGDLKPDNLLVTKDGTIVMIDYDGMYMPSFGSNIVNEIGSPDYQHPSRTFETFSKKIDDFSLLVILIEILCSSVQDEFSSPIFSRHDYNDIIKSSVVSQIFPSSNQALNIAVAELANSLLQNQMDISNEVFIRLGQIIANKYYKDSDVEYRLIKEECQEDRRALWKFHTNGYRGKEEDYPVLPSIDVEGYDFEHDGYPCYVKDGCLLKVYDLDGGSYMGESWDEDWDLIVAPDNIVTIADEAFKDCHFTQFVVLPNSLKSIGDNVFVGCDQLQYIVLPEKVERFGEHLLNLWPQDYIKLTGCKDLKLLEQFEKEIIIPFSEEGRRRTFKGSKWTGIRPEYLDLLDVYNESCCNFRNFLVPNGCKEYYQNLLPQYKDYIIDFSEFINSDDVNVNPLTVCIANKIGAKSTKIIKYTRGDEVLVIPSTVKTICSYAFSGNDKIKKVVIPESVTSIGNYVFKNCKNLECIELPNTMTSIPIGFLSGCEKIKEINLPRSIWSIGDSAFSYCKSLNKIQIPSRVDNIGSHAFSHCESLTSISFRDDMVTIDSNAFWGCKNLIHVGMPKKIKRLGSDVFKDCKSLLSLEIPSGIKYLPTRCVENCTSLRYIFLPRTIETIADHSLSGCTNLNTIELPMTLSKIGSGAFYHSGIKKISIPSNVETISDAAFIGCDRLMSISIPSNTKLRKLEKRTFSGCSMLLEIHIPENIEEIEEWCFEGCSNLFHVTLPSKLKIIANGLFSRCRELYSITGEFPHITSIGNEAFFQCRNLKNFVVTENVTEIGHNSFCGVDIQNISFENNDHFEKDNMAIYTKGRKSLIEVLMNSASWEIPSSVEDVRPWSFNGCKFNKLVVPNSVNELCENAFVSCSIDRIEISKELVVHHSTFDKGIKEIAVPRDLINHYKRAVLTPGGNSIYDIDKKFVCIE